MSKPESFKEMVARNTKVLKATKSIPYTGSLSEATHINGKKIVKKVGTSDGYMPKRKEWTKSDEKGHLSDVKAGRSWNKIGSQGVKNPHL